MGLCYESWKHGCTESVTIGLVSLRLGVSLVRTIVIMLTGRESEASIMPVRSSCLGALTSSYSIRPMVAVVPAMPQVTCAGTIEVAWGYGLALAPRYVYASTNDNF